MGGMFVCAAVVNNPLYLSLFMEFFGVFRSIQTYEFYYTFCSLYPAFLGQYMGIEFLPFHLSVCEGLRNFGHTMALLKWPNDMFCGGRNCWRSQYMYSHEIFYNRGSNANHCIYVVWYSFAKSQRRQCCCPYRKLKS